MNNPQYHATRVLQQVFEQNRSLNDCLPYYFKNTHGDLPRGLIQEMCFGVCRYFYQLDAIQQQLISKSLKAKDNDIKLLILIGLYQLRYMQVPPHAAVSETVKAAKSLRKPWANGLINAVLRNYLREQDSLNTIITASMDLQFSHPQWLVDEIKTAWPEQASTVLAENNNYPPMHLRVDTRVTSREEVLEALENKGIKAQASPVCASAITLQQARNVTDIPGFSAGHVSVQDIAPQFTAPLLELAPQQRVLDACAAPGGKTLHILQSEPELDEVVALDINPSRLARIEENLSRASVSATLIAADGNDVASWWDGTLFDRILLDAPCSATGVIRRHPDIKILRQAPDIDALATTQLQLLNSLWPLLKPKGILLYATCSILPKENHELLAKFLSQHADAIEKVIEIDIGIPVSIGRQILPGMHGMDGFYYGRLLKH